MIASCMYSYYDPYECLLVQVYRPILDKHVLCSECNMIIMPFLNANVPIVTGPTSFLFIKIIAKIAIYNENLEIFAFFCERTSFIFSHIVENSGLDSLILAEHILMYNCVLFHNMVHIILMI